MKTAARIPPKKKGNPAARAELPLNFMSAGNNLIRVTWSRPLTGPQVLFQI